MLTKNMKTKSMVVGITATLGLSLGVAGSALAVINPQIELSDNPVGIVVSPSKGERLSLSPGSVNDGEFIVRSTGTETGEFFAELAPHSINKVTKERDYNTETPRTHIAKWVDLEVLDCDVTRRDGAKVYFTMRPQEECFVKYHVVVPSDAMGGSQDAGIFIQSVNDGGGSGIMNSFRVGYMLYSNVDGPEANYDGQILSNNVPWLVFDRPVYIKSEVSNTGNLDFDATYEVTINDWFGGAELYSETSNLTILADSQMPNTIVWQDAPHIGIFKITQKISMLDHESSVTKLVIMLPLWLVIILVVVVTLLVAALVLEIHERKRDGVKRNKKSKKRSQK
jgi:hypothetical protein